MVLESELDRLGIVSSHSSPYHPQTCGKVERFHQTLKRFLRCQAAPENLAHLQLQLDAFRNRYNQDRPHDATGGKTPLQAFEAKLKAHPTLPASAVQYRVRYLGRLRHIYVSYRRRRQPVTLLIAGQHLKVVAEDGSIVRELVLDAGRNYQPVEPTSMSTMS